MKRALPLSAMLILLPLLAGCRRVSWQVIASPPEPPARHALDADGDAVALSANPLDAGVREGHMDAASLQAGVSVVPADADRDPPR